MKTFIFIRQKYSFFTNPRNEKFWITFNFLEAIFIASFLFSFRAIA